MTSVRIALGADMIEITKFQESLLKRLGSGNTSKYAATKGIEADGAARSEIDRYFDEAMRLVEDGLLYDLSSMPKFKKVCDSYMEDEGREIHVLGPSKVVEILFDGVKRVVN